MVFTLVRDVTFFFLTTNRMIHILMKIFYISIALTTISIVYLSYVQKIEINASLTSQKLNSNIKEKKRFKIEQNRSIEANDCNNEWLILNSNVYFRPNLAFYYSDLNKIKLYLEHRSSYDLNITLIVDLIFKRHNPQQFLLDKIKYEKIAQHGEYKFAAIETQINLFSSIDAIQQIQVEVKSQSCNSSIRLELKIKRFNQIESLKDHSIVCSKVYYVNKELGNQFKWWIEMNRIHGYKKVVIYNNSIENSNEFNKLFSDNMKFVQLIQFKCIPNFLDVNNTQKPFINDFREIGSKYKKQIVTYHVHFEEFVFTECYLENKDKYKYITINDQDETVVPRYLNDFRKIQTDLIENNIKFTDKSKQKCFYGEKNLNNIEEYLKKLKTKLIATSKNQNISFHFSTGIYIKDKTMNVFFNQLGYIFNETSFSNQSNQSMYVYSINVKENDEKNNRKGGQLMNFNVTIKSQKEFLYAKYLYKLYFNVIKPFNQRNQNELKKIYEPFNRLFYLLGPSTTWFSGKVAEIKFIYLSEYFYYI